MTGTNERFEKLSAGYEKGQAELQESSATRREIVNAVQVEAVNIQSLLKIVRRYTEPTELTPALLREFVDRVVVHEADKSSGHRVQRIAIHYNFIGELTFPRSIAAQQTSNSMMLLHHAVTWNTQKNLCGVEHSKELYE